MHLTDTILTPEKRTVDISTIDFPPETCLFWDELSYVVESYDNAPSAARGHKSWCKWGERIDEICENREEGRI